VADRIAQTLVAMELEQRVEPRFHPDSYGYRPNRSALDAVGVCRMRCWESGWVVDLDIQKFFDSVDHVLMVKAVEANTDQPWVVLYVKRWLVAPIQHPDGSLHERDRGTPQGSAVSPVLANLFLTTPSTNGWPGTFPTRGFDLILADQLILGDGSHSARPNISNSLSVYLLLILSPLEPEFMSSIKPRPSIFALRLVPSFPTRNCSFKDPRSRWHVSFQLRLRLLSRSRSGRFIWDSQQSAAVIEARGLSYAAHQCRIKPSYMFRKFGIVLCGNFFPLFEFGFSLKSALLALPLRCH
jgi:hypothetical protein